MLVDWLINLIIFKVNKMKKILITIAIFCYIVACFLNETSKKQENYTSIFEFKTNEVEAKEEKKEVKEIDFCGLKDVVCEDESEWITAEFSAYNNVESQCDSSPDTTASNKKIKGGEKWVAVNGYEFGTKIEIEGMGIYTVEDRMNRRYGINNIDILFHKDTEKALEFGRKKLRYRVINN